MALFDWLIPAFFLLVLTFATWKAKNYSKSVADFLSANRCAGRYLIAVSMGAAGAGAINILAVFEMYYHAGWSARWWEQMMAPVVLMVLVSGWVVYRFRQTRALTMAQFFEMRYSRRFRVFAGILSFISGLAGFAIAPAIGARFFICYCGFPEQLHLAGLEIGTYPLIMFILLTFALFYTFIGGQITILVTDFLQGIFSYVIILSICLYLFFKYDWSLIIQGMSQASPGASLINPFDTGKVKDFNAWFFVIWAFSIFYTWQSWQGMQGHNTSALTPHEARMAQVLNSYGSDINSAPFILIPAVALCIMNCPQFSHIADQVRASLNQISNPQIQKQVSVAVILSKILPTGLLGAFMTLILGSFISSVNSSLHSWGSIFIQDVVMPLRKRRISQENHLFVLKVSIVGVAFIVFLFSLYFRQVSYIMMWISITAAIYAGAGAVIIGGLYWKRGTTAGAWTALIVGLVISVGGITIKQVNPDFPINEQVMSFIAMISALVSYVIVSLLGRESFDLDKMLNRGKYAAEIQPTENSIINSVLKRLGVTSEFTRGDKVIFLFANCWMMMWFIIFAVGGIWNLTVGMNPKFWYYYWRFAICAYASVGLIAAVWLTIGGFRDLSRMIKRLENLQRDADDDGSVNHHDIAPEVPTPAKTRINIEVSQN